MLVKMLQQLNASGGQKIVAGGKARTTRFLVAADGLGFTMSDVRLAAGVDVCLWYKHHWEANYIVGGAGTLIDLENGRNWPLAPGVIYTVGPKDRHRVTCEHDLHIISIFNPPLTGTETHDADGSYGPSGAVLPGRETLFVKTLSGLEDAGRKITVAGGTTSSTRILLHEDQVGFSLCDVNLAAGRTNKLWYKHHWEANYILDGTGEVTDLDNGEACSLAAGTMYIVGPDDRHSLRAHTDLHLLSIFNPPLTGNEQHDDDGTLPASGPLPPGPHKAKTQE